MISTPAQLLQPALLPDYKITWFWGGWVGGGHDKHTRSAAEDQPALLPDFKITWFWGGGVGGVHGSTPAQLLACSFTGLQNNMVLGGRWGGGHGKHTRSTAADQPALVPDYKITWLWGGGMISTPAELLHPSKFISFWVCGVGWGGVMISTPAQLNQPSLLCNEMGA